MLQSGASLRPVITNRSWTPPSGVPSAFLTNRASRTGPLATMKGGTAFRAPSKVATATCGLAAGLEPPVAGKAWQPAQPFMLKRGPSPIPSSPGIVPETESISSNTVLAAAKKACSGARSPASGPPAPAVPPRQPGVERMKEVGARYPVSEDSYKTNNNQCDKRQSQKTFCGYGK